MFWLSVELGSLILGERLWVCENFGLEEFFVRVTSIFERVLPLVVL
jgi:hypothetical protein